MTDAEADRSVVLVTIDSLRADRCGHLGGAGATPALDAMARDGLAFETAVAPGPSTYESMPAAFTGRHMVSYATDADDELGRRNRLVALNTRAETIPEWFDRRGYETAAFTTNPYTGAHTNFARGFDRYEDFLGGDEGPLMRRAARVPVLSELKHLVTLARGDRASKPWDAYYDDVLAWVEGADGPYFLWVFLLDPHTPYLPPAERRPGGRLDAYYRNWRLWADKKWGFDLRQDAAALRALYDGAVRHADAFLARLRSDLAAAGDAPAVAVHADHGEAFGEHGAFGHHGGLYEENLRVPLVLANAGASGRVREPTSLTRLPALLRAAARGDAGAALSPERDEADGDEGERDSGEQDGRGRGGGERDGGGRDGAGGADGRGGGWALARTLGAERVAVRGPSWKYVATTDPAACRVTAETFYDLAADPAEGRNVAAEREDAVAACRRIVRRRLAHEREAAAVTDAAEGAAR